MKSYRELRVWEASVSLTEAIYAATKRFPADERFALTLQLRRAAVSVPSNIAEGHASGRRAVFQRHLAIAAGSLAEVETQIEIARRLGYLNAADPALDEHLDKTRPDASEAADAPVGY
jgi:four helix bundle protein